LRNICAVFGFWVALAVYTPLHGQPPASQVEQPGGGRGRGAAPAQAYPPRPPGDPASIERGKGLYGVRCAFCHGADTRGGDGGPSLLRSQVVQDDQHGEVIAPIIRGGRPPRMPPFELTDVQAADVSAFLHGFQINSRDPARVRPESILTGDATAGEAYFRATCASCHSPARDLKGIASRLPDPRALQQWWLIPGGGGGRGRGADPAAGAVSATTATVTLRSGQKYEGRLIRIDEFLVSVVEADGTTRSFARNGETPKVEVHDPLQPHKALLRTYTDRDIHDVTAYLVTLK
jgi:cytochrome c oxidase cbb3-type subunit 3